MQKSNWPIESVVQALVDNNSVENVTDADIRIFLSYHTPINSVVPNPKNTIFKPTPGEITPHTTPGKISNNLISLHDESKRILNH